MIAEKFRISTAFMARAGRGKNIQLKLFRAVQNPSWDDVHHIAVVVSKKIAGTAVVRNRLRRNFYDGAFRCIDASQKPTAVVFFPTKESCTATRDDIFRALREQKIFI